ncbi:MAG TPA: PDZ domain-containing protein, partial [Candidatus Nitrosotalea sp.]|nr:PDZ domain-containing protein [Candidatus Nitrosotalea sp.]
NCELYQFIQKEPIVNALPTSQQELEMKYPVEYGEIMKAIQTPEYAEYISTHNSTKMPIEMKQALASIIIKSSSINPNLEPSIIEVAGSETPDALYAKVLKEDPDCAKKIQSKSELYALTVPRINYVVKGSGAEKAGLLKDDIITAINGTHISFSSDLSKLKLKVNQTTIISITRNGKPMQIPVILSPSKDDPQKGMLGIGFGN